VIGILASALSLRGESRSEGWVSHGPFLPPGVISLIADSGGASATLYAATTRGLFNTTDAGTSWQQVGGEFLGGLQIDELQIDPLRSGTIYSLVGRNLPATGLAKSSDGGRTWSWLIEARDVSDSYLGPIAIDPHEEGTLYLGIPALGTSFLLKSTDGGISWTDLPEFPIQTEITSLVAAPNPAGTYYAGTAGAGVFKTTDACRTWVSASSGLPVPDADIIRLAAGPGPSPRLYALCFPGGQSFRSDDGGASWRQIFQRAVDPVLIEPSPLTDSEVYLATFEGVLYGSSDGGEHETRMQTGLGQPFLTAVVQTASGLFLATGDALLDQGRAPRGILRSPDGGSTWSRADSGLPRREAEVACVAIAPNVPMTIYAGTLFSGLFKSSDGGQTWAESGSQPSDPDASISALAADPHDGNVVYASDGNQLHKSTDGGATWGAIEPAPGDFLLGVSVDPIRGEILYVGTQSSGILKSIDAGATWSTILEPGPMEEDFEPPAIAPSNPDILYTTVLGQLFTSTDQGATWAPRPFSSIGHVVVDPMDPATVLVGEVNSACPSVTRIRQASVGSGEIPGVFRSTDGGLTWEPPAGSAFSLPVTAMAVNPADRSRVYAATSGFCSLDGLGLLASRDGGRTWSSVDRGLPRAVTFGLTFASNGSRLFAATAEGVFTLEGGPEVSPLPWQGPVEVHGRHP
jgi:photosystem II stability/assembly factor-like uncharacterized protein